MVYITGDMHGEWDRFKEKQIIRGKTKLIPGTFIPMEYLCNLVDDGNMDVTGTKIFTNVFRTVEVKFQEYFIAFLSGDYY